MCDCDLWLLLSVPFFAQNQRQYSSSNRSWSAGVENQLLILNSQKSYSKQERRSKTITIAVFKSILELLLGFDLNTIPKSLDSGVELSTLSNLNWRDLCLSVANSGMWFQINRWCDVIWIVKNHQLLRHASNSIERTFSCSFHSTRFSAAMSFDCSSHII